MPEEPQLDAEFGPESVNTMAELSRALKRRRLSAGFSSLPELLKKSKRDSILPRSTAYNLENGAGKSSWVSVETYLKACGVHAPEIEIWRAAHGRAVWNYENSAIQSEARKGVPTAKQLSEMGSEQAGRILGQISLPDAALLLGRVSLEQALTLLPEINPAQAVSLIAGMRPARVALIFEKIKPDTGAELLAEMPRELAIGIIVQLDTSSAAALLAEMPRTWAVRLLTSMGTERSNRILVEIPPAKAVKLLSELPADFTVAVIRTANARRVAKILDALDSDHANALIEELDETRAVDILARVSEQTAATFFSRSSESAWRMISMMSVERLAALFGYLIFGRQGRLLEDGVDSTTAARMLQLVKGDVLRYSIDDISPIRAVEILHEMDRHEAVLLLAVSRPFFISILRAMPESEAEQMRNELAPANLARHLSEVNLQRAAVYASLLEDSVGEVLSKVDRDLATRIIEGIEDFDTTAQVLSNIEVSMASEAIQNMANWEAAQVLTEMTPRKAAAILKIADAFTTEQVLYHLEDPDEQKSWPGAAERRAQDRKFAVALRKEISAMP